MKTITKTVVVTMILALAVSSIASAQQQRSNDKKEPPTFAQLLKEMDKNEDGKLAKSEVKGHLKDDFAKIDTDEDGFISEKELKAAPKPKRGERKSK